MATDRKTFQELIDQLDAVITTNGANKITGAILNALLKLFNASLGAMSYDNTRTYDSGVDVVLYSEALYRCTTDVTAAEAFDSAKWTKITIIPEIKAGQTITGGSNTVITHTLGTKYFSVTVQNSAGQEDEVMVVAKDTTSVTLFSNAQLTSRDIILIPGA